MYKFDIDVDTSANPSFKPLSPIFHANIHIRDLDTDQNSLEENVSVR